MKTHRQPHTRTMLCAVSALTLSTAAIAAGPAASASTRAQVAPAADPFALTVTVASDGTVSKVDGSATVHGTFTCSEPISVNIWGSVTEVVKGSHVLQGGFQLPAISCIPGSSVPWSGTAAAGDTAFRNGDAEVHVTANAYDPTTGSVYVDQSAVVKLTWTRIG